MPCVPSSSWYVVWGSRRDPPKRRFFIFFRFFLLFLMVLWLGMVPTLGRATWYGTITWYAYQVLVHQVSSRNHTKLIRLPSVGTKAIPTWYQVTYQVLVPYQVETIPTWYRTKSPTKCWYRTKSKPYQLGTVPTRQLNHYLIITCEFSDFLIDLDS